MPLFGRTLKRQDTSTTRQTRRQGVQTTPQMIQDIKTSFSLKANLVLDISQTKKCSYSLCPRTLTTKKTALEREIERLTDFATTNVLTAMTKSSVCHRYEPLYIFVVL